MTRPTFAMGYEFGMIEFSEPTEGFKCKQSLQYSPRVKT